MKKEMIIGFIVGLFLIALGIFFLVTFNVQKTNDNAQKEKIVTENSKENVAEKSKGRKSDENLQLLCKLTKSDDNSSITDWYSIEAYASLTQAIKNPVSPETELHTEYDVHVALPDDVKKVKVFYEIFAILLPVEVHKNTISKNFTRTFTIDYIGSKFHQSQYIVQIQCDKGIFFICIDNDSMFTNAYSINNEEEPVYAATINKDYGWTIDNIEPIKFFNTLEEASKNSIHFNSGIEAHGLDMVFYCVTDKDLDIEIYDKKHNKPVSHDVYKEGNLSVCSLKGIAGVRKYDRNGNFLVTFKYEGQKPKYLEIEVD